MNEFDFSDVYEWLWQVEVFNAAVEVYGPCVSKVKLQVEKIVEREDNQPFVAEYRITGMTAYEWRQGNFKGQYVELAPLPYERTENDNLPLHRLPYENAPTVVTVKDTQRYVLAESYVHV